MLRRPIPGEFVARLTEARSKSEHRSGLGWTAERLNVLGITQIDKNNPPSLHKEHKRANKRVGHIKDVWFNSTDKWLYMKGQLDMQDKRAQKIGARMKDGKPVCVSVAFEHPIPETVKSDDKWYNKIVEASFVKNPFEEGAVVVACHSSELASKKPSNVLLFSAEFVKETEMSSTQPAQTTPPPPQQGQKEQAQANPDSKPADASAKYNFASIFGNNQHLTPGQDQQQAGNVMDSAALAQLFQGKNPEEIRDSVFGALNQLPSLYSKLDSLVKENGELRSTVDSSNRENALGFVPVVETATTDVKESNSWTEADRAAMPEQLKMMSSRHEFKLPLKYIQYKQAQVADLSKELNSLKAANEGMYFHSRVAAQPPQMNSGRGQTSPMDTAGWNPMNHPTAQVPGTNTTITSHSAETSTAKATDTFDAIFLKRLREVKTEFYKAGPEADVPNVPVVKRVCGTPFGNPLAE